MEKPNQSPLDFLGNNPLIQGMIKGGQDIATNVGNWFKSPDRSWNQDQTIWLDGTPPPKQTINLIPMQSPAAQPTPNQQTVQQPGSGFNIPGVPQNIAQTIGQVFTAQGEPMDATGAASILSHPKEQQIKGVGTGENTNFQTNFNYTDPVTGKKYPPEDIPNKLDKNGNWNDNAPVAQITNPSTGKQEDSIDRGLWRINNGTFYDYYYTRGFKPLLESYGISNWDDMKDPTKNTIMAKIILQNQGGKAWYAAPADIGNKFPGKR